MISPPSVQKLLRLSLEEDIGRGDVTTAAVVPPGTVTSAVVWVKQPTRIAGLPFAESVFRMLDGGLTIERLADEGADATGPSPVLRVAGDAHAILAAERTALNILGRLCGIATLTRDAAERLSGTRARLVDTRKTTPGWRWLEKYAVRVGGGVNHRFGLDDMILIKDNHIAIAGSVRAAVERARTVRGLGTRIEVEVETLEQLEEALAAGADLILLDNMTPALVAEAVRRVRGRVPLEASGGVTLERLREIAETGVDYISMGALTHGAASVDVGLDVEMTG
jgi:nicotinate-nucleotide pyrophosphorylase (carboxylating)